MLPCPFCSSTSTASGFTCGACGRSLVLLGRWRLEALLERDGSKTRYAARDAQNPYASAVEAWLSRDPALVDADGALAAGHEDGGMFVVIRPAREPAGASPWPPQGAPARRGGGGCLIAGIAFAILGVVVAAGAFVYLRRARSTTLPAGTPTAQAQAGANAGTVCTKPMSISGQNLVGDTGGILATDGCHLDVKSSNIDGPVIARGTAHVRITDCNLGQVGTLPAISVSDQADVTIGSSIVSGEFAADVEDHGHLTVEGGIVEGRVIRGPQATLDGIAEKPPPAPTATASTTATAPAAPDAGPDWSKNACVPIFGCYQKAKTFGQVNGKMTVSISAAGKPTAVAITGAPPPVQACLRAAGMAETLDGYSGPPGKLTCSWGGTFMEGGEMAMYDSDFTTAK